MTNEIGHDITAWILAGCAKITPLGPAGSWRSIELHRPNYNGAYKSRAYRRHSQSCAKDIARHYKKHSRLSEFAENRFQVN